MSKNEWFVEWFNSHYYHLLYKKRDLREAEFFIDNLLTYFTNTKKNFKDDYTLKTLDLACGKGRHSLYLNVKGLDVTGIDLSSQSIAEAMKLESPHLKFKIGDMRQPFGDNEYDFIFNIFTSFGYFETDEEEISVLNNIYKALKINGTFVFDFLNISKIDITSKCEESQTIDGIVFKINKQIKNNIIHKFIEVNDNGSIYQFEERVKLLGLEKMKALLEKAKLSVTDIFGSYSLDKFDQNSDRLILIVNKLS